ncbi:DUF7471 family protein [Halomarina halobia]
MTRRTITGVVASTTHHLLEHGLDVITPTLPIVSYRSSFIPLVR